MNKKILKKLILITFFAFLIFVVNSQDIFAAYGYKTSVYDERKPVVLPFPASNPTYSYNNESSIPVKSVDSSETIVGKATKVEETNVVAKNTNTNVSRDEVSYDDDSYKSRTSNDSKENNLTALSLKGSGGFMPSSIWQWIIVVLLIFAIVILSRMVIKSFDQKA